MDISGNSSMLSRAPARACARERASSAPVALTVPKTTPRVEIVR